MDAPVVADLYCPFTLEHLEQETSSLVRDEAVTPGDRRMAAFSTQAADILRVQNSQLADADFFLCASERQRDFWLGALHTAGRVNPRTYAADPTLRSLIDVVPFGLSCRAEEAAAAAARALGRVRSGNRPPGLKGVVPGSDSTTTWSTGAGRSSTGRTRKRWSAPSANLRASAATSSSSSPGSDTPIPR